MTPSRLVLKRLEDIVETHETSLAGLTISRNHSNNKRDNNSVDSRSLSNKDINDEGRSSTIVEAALRRSYCSQPPLDSSHLGGGSWNVVADLNLNPAERVAPHKLVLSSSCHHQDMGHDDGFESCNHDTLKSTSMSMPISMPMPMPMPISNRVSPNVGLTNDSTDQSNINSSWINNGTCSLPSSIVSRDDIESVVASSTLKVITAISALCDEVHELNMVAHAKFIPQLTLFGHDLKILTVDSTTNQSSSATATLAAVAATAIDDKAMAKRDSDLLRRIGAFVSTLQTIMNFSLRCQRLLRNLIAQLDGCFRPISSWGSYSDPANTTNDNDEQGNPDTHNHTHDSDRRDASVWTTDTNTPGNHIHTTSNDPALFSRTHKHKHKHTHNRIRGVRKNGTTCLPLLPVGDAIAKILGILVSIDHVIAHNLELQEAWDLYKSVVSDESAQLEIEMQKFKQQQRHWQQRQGAAHASKTAAAVALDTNDRAAIDDDHGCNNTDDDDGTIKMIEARQKNTNQHLLALEEQRLKLLLLERMLLQIDFTLLTSRSYVIAIEQNFDPGSRFFNAAYYSSDTSTQNNHVGDYATNISAVSAGIAAAAAAGGALGGAGGTQPYVFTLHEEIKNLIMIMFRKCFSLLQTKHETTERKDLIGIYGMYGLYRCLLPSHLSPDEAMHKSLSVDLPSICPILPLIGTTDVPFLPLKFLSRYGSNFNFNSTMNEARQLMKKNDTVFFSSVQKLHADAALWLLAADSDLAPSTLSSSPSSQQQYGGEETPDDDEDDNPSSLPLGGNTDDNDTLLSHKNMGQGQQQLQRTPTLIVEFKTVVILRGIRIARCSMIMLKHYLHMHKSLDVPIRSDHIPPIEKLCSIIKSIEITLRGRRRSSVVSFQRAALKMLASSIFKRFESLR